MVREAVPAPELAEYVPPHPVVGEDGRMRLKGEWRIGRPE